VEDADIYVDFDNKGFNMTMFSVKALESIRVRDPFDKDMSGASIFAVKNGTGVRGPPVDIAVAWGQDPQVSKPNQPISMDMGTVTLPLTNVKVAKLVDKVLVNAGEFLVYTIRVANVGQKDMEKDILIVKDTLDPDVVYVAQSTVMKYQFGTFDVVTVPDSGSGTPFPLDAEGFTIPILLPRRGSTVDITFKVKIVNSLTIGKSKIVNRGILSQKNGKDLPYETTSIVDFKASVAIANTVLLGADGSKCASQSTEKVSDKLGSNVTYCFKITNTGKSHLIGIQLTDEQIGNYTQLLNTTLAPGASTTVFTTKTILKAGKNDAVVTAIPAFSNGKEISDASAVSATDPSEVGVVPFKPSIFINNTVYLGTDGKGTKCGTADALESVTDIFDSPVTYCFVVTNTGDTWLNGLSVGNKALNYTSTISGIMAPGEKRTLFVEKKIIQDLDNMAIVTGTPVMSDGLNIDGLIPISNQDPSAVKKLSFIPSIKVEDTVYLGTDGGKKCGTSAAVEFVTDFYNKPVTYCFKIINDGETSLKTVEIVNNDLAYSNKAVGTLASGQSVMLFLEKTLATTMKNTANVTGKPATANGRDLNDLRPVNASDPSQVALKDNKPSIAVENTVVLGHNGGCGTNLAKESVEGYPGTKVTYCFNVKNTGDSFLDSIALVNDKLAHTQTVPRLAPGVSTMISIQRTITGSTDNIVKVTGNPTLETGVDIPNQPDVTASDTSSVVQLAYIPAVEVANTVYLGSKESLACDKSLEFVQGPFGSDVTYCFTVKNSGNTYLKDIKLDDIELGFKDSTSIKLLAPGASALVFTGGKISKPMQNTVMVTATPSKESGESLAMQDVKSSDPSSVGRIANKPSIQIENKVFIGEVDDNYCGTDMAKKMVSDIYMTDVVYCLRVNNTGDTYLADVTIVDGALEYNGTLSAPLAPGASELIVVPGKIVGDLRNVATVTANPVLRDGTDIDGIADVSATDDSAVTKLTFVASIKVDNTVYKGVDGGKSCNTATEFVKDLYGNGVTYCFKVTNTGATSLKSVILSNEMLVYSEVLSSPLKPAESKLFTFPSIIDSNLENIINATAIPVMPDGRDLLDMDEVSASDPSSVGLLPHAPKINITNTVYLGGSDNGAQCASAAKTVQDKYGAKVTYCFTVKNTGDTYLKDVILSDKAIELGETKIGDLAPGASTTYPVVGTITGNLTNEAGCNIPGVDDVKASDTSSVKQVANQPSIDIENTVYLGNDGGAACADSKLEYVTGYPYTNVTYCLQIKNTGDSYLINVAVVDTELKVDNKSITRLAPGETKMIPVSNSILGNLTNTAKVTAVPALQDGTPIPNIPPVTDSDTSGVLQQNYAPAISIDNVVGLGSGSDACGSARNLAEGFYGDKVTYCFIVKNIGDTVLSGIKIVDDQLTYTSPTIKPLAPGESTTLMLPSSITVDLINTAVATGIPAKKDLSPIAGLAPVTSKDASEVNKFDVVGGIQILNTVFVNGAGASCDTAVESVDGTYGTPVTYCLQVINTGDTYLNTVVITDTDLNYKSGPIKTLAPGESIQLTVPSKITSTLKNTALVTGNPVTEAGKDILDLQDVRCEDTSKVNQIDIASTVTIANTVYPGADGGKLCGTAAAVETAQGYYGDAVTYCFEVQNTGAAYLTEVSVTDKELGFTDITTIKSLAPGETVMIPFASMITSTLANTAKVVGSPSLKDGTVIPGKDPVFATDPSKVEKIDHIPSIDIVNTVYLGGATNNNGQSSCGTPAAVDHVEHYAGAVVTYCFEVINKGDSYLNNVVITDKELAYTTTLPKSLAPGESFTLTYPSTITAPLKNTAVVTANPTIKDGTDIPNTNDVTWSDASSVGELVYFPSVTVDNKVYIGTDNGLACNTSAVESVSGKSGTAVVYCFNITNTGDTYLGDIKFKDIELAYEDNSIAFLPPKASKMLVFLSTITGNLTNNAVVVANPTLADGADISGAKDVTATDPSSVVIKASITGDVRNGDKDPYKPPTNSTKCMQDNWKDKGHNDTLVCASKEVYINTLKSDKPMTCKPGEQVILTVDASIQISGPRNDVGWYVAKDGGDALTGQCIVNGLQDNGAVYNVTNAASKTAGFVQWTTANGADGDQCGDVFIVNDGSAKLEIPIVVNATMPCTDENDDGVMDFAICFTWKTDATNAVCQLATNTPGTNCACFCTRVDVPNVEVVGTPTDPIAPC
jgi:uncharacterized repeat protein (TIGR01451 family)